MDVSQGGAGIGDDGPLGNLPVSIERVVAKLVDANRNAVEVEICQLTVAGGAKADAPQVPNVKTSINWALSVWLIS